MSHRDMNHGDMKSGSYAKFALMMAVSFVIMYGVMFLNVDKFDHVYLSVMRTYMTILMISLMAIVMMLFMRGMYKNQKINVAILAGSALIFIVTFDICTDAGIYRRYAMDARDDSASFVSNFDEFGS